MRSTTFLYTFSTFYLELFVAISNDSHTGKDIIKNINNSLWDPSSIVIDVTKIEKVQNTLFETEVIKNLLVLLLIGQRIADDLWLAFFRSLVS